MNAIRSPVAWIVIASACLAGYGLSSWLASDSHSPSPFAVGVYDRAHISEASGLVRSRTQENVFWTHNDSGAEAILYATTRSGRLRGMFFIENVTATDWEAITTDGRGRLFVGDFGNNGNHRQDLAVHIVDEPPVTQDKAVDALRSIKASGTLYFRYPEQTAFPARQKNFDAEALFWAQSGQLGHGTLFILTKHRSDSMTSLYRFNQTVAGDSVLDLELIAQADLGGGPKGRGLVTGVAVAPSGRSIAVLTYYAVFIYAVDEPTDNYLGRRIAVIDLVADVTKQVEAISWTDSGLIVSNEQGELFLIPEPEHQTRFPADPSP
ncbi:MAG: hypothetical protein ACON3Z_14945 [Bradymonadia bacterium]